MSPEVIIVGGGPAGSTAAAVLARLGRRIVLLERSPTAERYRVGESLLPYCWFPLQRSGALDAVRAAGFQTKQCVQFISPRGNRAKPYYFADHLDHEAATTWQVPRPVFDRLLLENAEAQGADVRLGVNVLSPIERDGAVVGVEVEDASGRRSELRAPLTIDASGREGLFMVRARRWKRQEHALDRVAIWSYFEGALRDPGRDEGATTIARIPGDGWFWLLPMAGDRMSIGVVSRADHLFPDTDRDPGAAFERAAASNPWVAARLAPARRAEDFQVTHNFSYRAQHCAADGVVLAGDAFTFLDPVFSPGVFLALAGGERAALAVDAALTAGRSDAGAFASYADWLDRAVEPMRKLIFAFYDEGFSFGELFKANPELRPDLTDCLIGNVDHDFGPLFAAMGRLTELPLPPDFGRPAL